MVANKQQEILIKQGKCMKIASSRHPLTIKNAKHLFLKIVFEDTVFGNTLPRISL